MNRFCLVVVLVFVSVRPVVADKGDIISRIEMAHSRYATKTANVVVYTVTQRANGQLVARVFWRSGEHFKLHSTNFKLPGDVDSQAVATSPSIVESYGGDYMFRLTRATPVSELAVRRMHLNATPQDRDAYDSSLNSCLALGVGAATSVMGMPLATMLNWPNVQIRDVVEGEQAITITFSIPQIPDSPEGTEVNSATVEMTNDDFLCIKSWDYVYTAVQDGKTFFHFDSSRLTYDEEIAGGLIPATSSESSGASSESIEDAVKLAKETLVTTCEKVDVGGVTDEMFLPSFYGLPNHLVGLDEPQGWPWIWWLIGSLNLMLLAIWLLRRYRVRSTA